MTTADVWAERHVLVTGGLGFIGSHVVEALVARGAKVTIVDDGSTGRMEHLSAVSRPTVVEMAVGDYGFGDWLAAQRFDLIYHLAGSGYVPPSVKDPYFDFARNLHPTIRLLECLRTNDLPAALIFASSAAVYGEPSENPTSEGAALNPISPYGVSKLAAERYVSVYARLYGLRTASMRLFSVYGPRQRKQVVYDFIDRLHRKPTELTVLGDGTQERDFSYVTDVAQAALLIAERGLLAGEVYNVASGATNSTSRLASEIGTAMRLRPTVHYTGVVRPGDPDRWSADISILRRLGYSAKVALPEGVQRTVQWYLDAAPGTNAAGETPVGS